MGLGGKTEGFMVKWFDNWKGFGSIEVRALMSVDLVQNPCYQEFCVEVQIGDLGTAEYSH